MTREEAIEIIQELWRYEKTDKYTDTEIRQSLEMAIKALEQESKTEQFAKWVAKEIFDDNWEYNKESFVELACRKLAKLGMVIRMDDEWELVKPQESEDKE
jgi:hypothetical protein